MGVAEMAQGNDRLDRLLDDTQAVKEVDGRDLRWMLLFFRQETQSSLDALQKSMGLQETASAALSKQVLLNSAAVIRVQQAHDDCPLSTDEGRDKFVNGALRVAVTDAVKAANGTKAMLGPLNRSEVISVLGWVIMALVVGLVYLATNGGVRVPLP